MNTAFLRLLKMNSCKILFSLGLHFIVRAPIVTFNLLLPDSSSLKVLPWSVCVPVLATSCFNKISRKGNVRKGEFGLPQSLKVQDLPWRGRQAGEW